MPKKHTPGYQTAKPIAAAHSSLAASRSNPSSSTSQGPLTVNERLKELRSSQRAGVAIAQPVALVIPRPQAANGPRANRIAGPPPPRSWTGRRTGLEGSRHAPKGSQDSQEIIDRLPPPMLPGQPLPVPQSLRAMVLRELARTLSQQIDERDNWLTYSLTTRMKAELIAVADLDPLIRITKSHIRYLFGPLEDDVDLWVSGGQDITHISLGQVIRERSDYTEIHRWLRRGIHATSEEVPESWETTNESTVVTKVDAPASFPRIPLLPGITHLSLARPTHACWSSLLDSKFLDALSHITHLDLSYWPAPYRRVPTHGETLLSELEAGQQEQVRLLNRLGKACRNLVWLGLEGCEEWSEVLTAAYRKPISTTLTRFGMESQPKKVYGNIQVDWNGVWRGLKRIRVSQAWIPTNFLDPQVSSGSIKKVMTMSTDMFMAWWERERRLRDMEVLISEWRLQANLEPISFETTPVKHSIDLEIRTLEEWQAVKLWKEKLKIDLKW